MWNGLQMNQPKLDENGLLQLAAVYDLLSQLWTTELTLQQLPSRGSERADLAAGKNRSGLFIYQSIVHRSADDPEQAAALPRQRQSTTQ